MTEHPKHPLPACGRVLSLNPEYHIFLPDAPLHVVEMGFKNSHAGAQFTHPNIARTAPRTYECRRGDKSWYQVHGVSHVLVIPREHITIIGREGHSYVYAEINGGPVIFNCSGGTAPDGYEGWADFLRPDTGCCLDGAITGLKRAAEVAVRGTAFEPFKFNDELEEEFYAANKGRWHVISAWGDWQPGVPKGMVGCCACVDGRRGGERAERWFLVPAAEYQTRTFSFIIDPDRHLETDNFTRYQLAA